MPVSVSSGFVSGGISISGSDGLGLVLSADSAVAQRACWSQGEQSEPATLAGLWEQAVRNARSATGSANLNFIKPILMARR